MIDHVVTCVTWIMLSVSMVSGGEPRFVKAWGTEGSADGEFHFCIGLFLFPGERGGPYPPLLLALPRSRVSSRVFMLQLPR